jgi:hypothetical protein
MYMSVSVCVSGSFYKQTRAVARNEAHRFTAVTAVSGEMLANFARVIRQGHAELFFFHTKNNVVITCWR